jgi:hypothetical protein
MSKNEKTALWVTAAIGVIVLIWLMLMRRGVIPGASDNSTYSFGSPSYTIAGPFNAPPTPANSGCCGCSSTAPTVFNSLGAMLDYFNSKSRDNFDAYEKQVYAAYPPTLKQYFNNSVGAQQFAQSQATFKYGNSQ